MPCRNLRKIRKIRGKSLGVFQAGNLNFALHNSYSFGNPKENLLSIKNDKL